jgi:glycosyltransferase involved in cell wall biosynthesis
MKLSVIVPAFNEEKLLGETLASIRNSLTELPVTSEILVCDNNSTDRTAEIARAAGAAVVFEPVNQIARARNAGAAQASGDWLVFVDADSQPSIGLFADVFEEIEKGKCMAGGSTVSLDVKEWYIRFWIGAWNRLSRLNRWAAGSFIFCEAAAFRELGGFDEKFYAGEEIDFSRRAKRLARRRGRAMVILHRHPLLTSNRKARLYSMKELVLFSLRVITTRGGALHRKDDCYAWYDGRR